MSNTAVDSQVLDYVEKSGHALQEAENLAQGVLRERAIMSELASKTAAALCSHGIIAAHEVKEMTTKLATHRGALEIAERIPYLLASTKEAAAKEANERIAQASGTRNAVNGGLRQVTKSASQSNFNSGGAIGQRRGQGERSEADRAMAEALGIPNLG